MSEDNYEDNYEDFVVSDETNDLNNNISGGGIYNDGRFINNLLIALVIILIIMFVVSFVMSDKSKMKQRKIIHNHPGCVNHGKVFNDLLIPSNFYDSKQQGFKYINWAANT